MTATLTAAPVANPLTTPLARPGTAGETVVIDAAGIDPVTCARDLISLAVDAEVAVSTRPTSRRRREVAAENLWILRSLLAGQWTAAHTARNSIEPIRLSPPAHPVRIV